MYSVPCLILWKCIKKYWNNLRHFSLMLFSTLEEDDRGAPWWCPPVPPRGARGCTNHTHLTPTHGTHPNTWHPPQHMAPTPAAHGERGKTILTNCSPERSGVAGCPPRGVVAGAGRGVRAENKPTLVEQTGGRHGAGRPEKRARTHSSRVWRWKEIWEKICGKNEIKRIKYRVG